MDQGLLMAGSNATAQVADAMRLALLDPKRLDAAFMAAWHRLADHASEPNVFHAPEYLAPAIDHCDPLQRARLITVSDGSTLVGLMPMAVERYYGRWPVSHSQNWRHPNCFLGTPLIKAGHERAFWQALLADLDRRMDSGVFLHLYGIATDGPVFAALAQLCTDQRRVCDIVLAEERAMLATTMAGQAYYEAVVRKKKRKEIARLRNRLADLGTIETLHGFGDAGLDAWLAEFLALEQAGWKGRNGSALADHAETRALFLAATHQAYASGKLHLVAMRLDGKPLAMLVNFLSPPGGFSFKTAFDEAYARFSPGVLLQIDNLGILREHGLAWMDSCAAEGHPMIDSLWAERRHVGRVSVGLKGFGRPALFAAFRQGERFMDRRRARRSPGLLPSAPLETDDD
ncbi:CelD/BcsL family acetyltransferase involved in cellulose biosynthesis [Blastomonas natatoria]|uniref:CelD/BcsL family acetyltransferase involved in cellulose biosynthesis n=1 Tax=Blastomonas natatoria TaxID=34015 RepID=A0A2V3V673_9SPHN|nr:GNAT family N-acetyltransferase [Blastomonas natatoria]PXW71265.1 CelD/BcsL family acetyltransferase involved in cellulose biosynthesis [Blastomonas natatoria]